MAIPILKVNRVEFIMSSTGIRHAWYLTVQHIDGQPCCFWSHHDCTGMSDAQAKTAFEREHFREVEELVKQKMIREANEVN